MKGYKEVQATVLHANEWMNLKQRGMAKEAAFGKALPETDARCADLH